MKTPYDKYRIKKEWKSISKAINDLEKNNDLKLFTPTDYVTGYICNEIFKRKTIKKKQVS